MLIEVSTAAPRDWDAFIDRHPGASAYHRAAVAEIGRSAFGLRTMFVTARDAQARLVGALPLVEQSSLMFGRFLISLPFFTYGGMLANDASTALALSEQVAILARERRVDHVELRQVASIVGLPFSQRLDKVSMVLPLPDSEARLAKQLGSKLRSQIRRAEREDLAIAWGSADLLPEFYRVFAATMHRLGTPIYAYRFFESACRALGDLASVIVVRVRGEAQAAAFTVKHGGRVEVPWAAATVAARQTAVNMRMYWELLCAAVRSGAESFDFGRSSFSSGTYRFKEQWGAQPLQLHWYYWLPAGAQLPRLNHDNPKFATAAALWRRMPLWCANVIGPRIARHLP